MNWEAIVGSLACPVTVLILAWGFSKQIKALVGRVGRAKLPGGAEISFGESRVDQEGKPTPEVEADKIQGEVRWGRTGNLFWVGHDLMWSIDVLLRGGHKAKVLHGIRQSSHHLKELGLGAWANRLDAVLSDVSLTLEEDLTAQKRDEFASVIDAISGQIGALAEMQQRDFRAWP